MIQDVTYEESKFNTCKGNTRWHKKSLDYVYSRGEKTRKERAEVKRNCYGGAGRGSVITGLGAVWSSEEVGRGRQGAGVLMYWSGPAES